MRVPPNRESNDLLRNAEVNLEVNLTNERSRCACYDSRPVVSILACLSAAGRGTTKNAVGYVPQRGMLPAQSPRLALGRPALPTYLPTYLPGYLPTYYLLTYYRHTYLPTYVPTYLPTYLSTTITITTATATISMYIQRAHAASRAGCY